MLLKTEIEKLHSSLFTTVGDKEKLFYHFITKQPFTGTLEIQTGDLDKICFAVFTNSTADISKEVQRVAPSEPFKHIHYSTNIISLIPVCLKSSEAKNKYLKNYFDSASIAEKLLLTKIFPSENLQFVPNPKTELDKLIDETFFRKRNENALQYLTSGFAEVNDVVSLLAFREAYLELLKIHPNTKIESQFSELSNEISKLISVVTKRIDIVTDIFSLLLFLLGSPLAVYEINKYYTQLEVDKLSNIWTFVSPLLIPIFYFGKKLFPKIFSFYDDFKHWLVVLWFSFLKVDYNKLSRLTTKE
jgi:hypothetical protein